MPKLKPIFEVTRLLSFEAAHQLSGLPADHQCSRMHGHSYKVEVVLRSTALDDTGFVLDFGAIKQVVEGRFDHQILNEQMRGNPTAENLCVAIAELLNDLIFKLEAEDDVSLMKVTVHETAKCSATLTFQPLEE